ncbi:TetR/AcrR family transcriptional regulator [Aeromicrobium sp.]|uniref:TetR/AcrR family transcriptional regulator n=1 Tax=Aeromicrobium sp. TaxID=1871063 RepID=UPI0028AEA31F|nr:TetR/AcrR family transcriptional regulator [Aeromicrobium sp.]
MHQPATRPRNRRALIVAAAGRVFGERGYHGASMEEIAHRVGITAPALYRHFPNKYALFAECANAMADGLLAVLDRVPSDAGLEPLLTEITRETLAHRDSGGVHRWEARHLAAEERHALSAKFTRVVERVAAEVPAGEDLPPDLRACAALGAIGSVTMHRTRIAVPRAEQLIVAAATGAASATVAPVSPSSSPSAPPAAPASRRDEVLAAAIPLFARDGFHHVTLGQVAHEVGVVPSAIYRHFPGKADILAAACLRAAWLLSERVSKALADPADSGACVEALVAAYVAYSFDHRDLTRVAEAELIGLPPALRTPLVQAQRDHVAIWVRLLRAARPELDQRQAAVLVHAGLGVVVEAGRRLRWQDTPRNRRAVEALVTGALGLGR